MRSRLPEDTSEASDRLSPHWLVFARCGTIPSGTENMHSHPLMEMYAPLA